VQATLLAAVGIAFLATAAFAGPGDTSSCEDLALLDLNNTTITSATHVPPAGNLPGYCEVEATVDPQTDVIVRLPDVWLHRYLHLGGGGFDGRFPPDLNGPLAAARQSPLVNGYVVVASNGGHREADYPAASFSADRGLTLGYATAAIYDADVVGKALVEAYYGTPATYRYFAGCSNGGKNASHAAGTFTDDYDGVISGAGVYGHSSDNLGGTDMSGMTAKWAQVAGTTPISAAKGMAVLQAQLAACDARDGLADGIISNPEACRFDPAELRCSGPSDDSCLTDEEIEAIETIRSDLVDASGRVIGAPFGLGDPSAAIFSATVLGGGFLSMSFGTGDPIYDVSLFDLERDFPTVMTVLDKVYAMTASLDGLTRYLQQGKRLMLWQGWEDMVVMPYVSTRIYHALQETAGPHADENVRLYMMPGVGHCLGGAGADTFNLLEAMAEWVENDVAPDDSIVASKIDPDTGATTFTRPLCEYPRVPVYKGPDPDDAGSFVCRHVNYARGR
jgi:feruloyl esterase